MMKKRMISPKNNQHRRRKIASALCMLLISSILLATASYAWLVMSVSPEVTGIATNIGANGALEIALLTTETRQNMDLIPTMGGSLSSRNPSANNSWGNLVDLDYDTYGLNNITLWPARLNANGSPGRYMVNPAGMLSVPTYGLDGRIIDLTDNTVSALFNGQENAFTYFAGVQDYGVRAIGTSSTLSVQGSALATAKSNINTYKNSAKNAAASVLNEYGDDLLAIVFAHASNSASTYDDADIAIIVDMLGGIKSSIDYIDLALRQGLVAVAASEISDEDLFVEVYDLIMDTSNELIYIVSEVSKDYTLPENFANWVSALDEMQNDVNSANSACSALSGGSYSWTELRSALDVMMNVEYLYVGEDKFGNLTAEQLMGMIGQDITLTLAPGSGILADIADFTDDYTAWVSYMGMEIEFTTMTLENPVYLTALSTAMQSLEAADNSSSDTMYTLDTTYGYALDLAFRTNVPLSDLLLQTDGMQRVHENSDNNMTQGGGSYMEFTTGADGFSMEQMLTLMDAVRVAFVDDQGNILCVAKLNTSNRTVNNGVVKAPLYLYAYELDEDGKMVMGERQKSDNVIVELQQNTAKAITVLVWLDGDIVDNTMVAATEEMSLSGNLNLQFASSADLVPAQNGELMNITANKDDLSALVATQAETYAAGPSLYTTISWEAYAAAYEYAVAVANNPGATENQVYKAAFDLTIAAGELTIVSHSSISARTEEIRDFMGETSDLARYIVKDENGNYYTIGDYTQEQLNGLNVVDSIYRVDYTYNLKDEGNGIMTPIYTDESWSALAAALYDAEAVDKNPNATDEQMNAALTALETAYDALQRKVYYLPFDYEGDLFYFAVTEETDTYGKWYYNDFTRVISDLLILKLDARAESINIGALMQSTNLSADTSVITPYIELLSNLYPSLSEEDIIGAKWNVGADGLFRELMNASQAQILRNLIAKAVGINSEIDTNNYPIEKIDYAGAEAMVNQYDNSLSGSADYVQATEAADVIRTLQNAIADALNNKMTHDESNMGLPMTADQRILLTAAINSAEAIEGYSDAAKTELDALRAAVEEAKALVASEDVVTKQEAVEVLELLNAQLAANGKAKVTVANTIIHSIPVGSEVNEIVNLMEIPGIMLQLTGKTGSTTLEVVVVTEHGVVFTISQQINVYTVATGAEFVETNADNETVAVTNREVSVGESFELSARLYFTIFKDEQAALEELGNITIADDGSIVIANPDVIAEDGFTWSSDNTNVVTILGKNAETCTINAVGEGSATITLSVTTATGKVLTIYFSVIVTAASGN